MPGIDPVSLAMQASQFGIGAAQALFSGKKKAERDLEDYANSKQTSPSILDYYNKALNRSTSNPYTSQFYQNQINQLNRNMATGLNAAQDRRGGLATVGALTQGADDASARAGVTAEGQQAQALGTLGQASRALTNEQNDKYNLLFQLKAQKAAAANKQQAAGFQNMFGALGGASEMNQASKMYGGGDGAGSMYSTGNGDGTSFMKKKNIWGN